MLLFDTVGCYDVLLFDTICCYDDCLYLTQYVGMMIVIILHKMLL